MWVNTVTTPASVRKRTRRARYPLYSGCTAGHKARVVLRDYSHHPLVIRIAGRYVGVQDEGAAFHGHLGGSESLDLVDLATGKRKSTRSFTPSVQDNGGSEANEPGPLGKWAVASSGWLVYIDHLSDFEGYGIVLDAFDVHGATTLDIVPQPPLGKITRLEVGARTVSWISSISGARSVTLSAALLPGAPPNPAPSACALVPPAVAAELLGPLSQTQPPPPVTPPAGNDPPAPAGTNETGCAYAAAADQNETLNVSEQTVTEADVATQRQEIDNDQKADNGLVLPGFAAVLDSRIGMTPQNTEPEDLRMFIGTLEIDIWTNSDRASRRIESAGLVTERALNDVPPATTCVINSC